MVLPAIVDFIQQNQFYVLWTLQVLIGVYFVVTDKWIWGFKIFPFGISIVNFNSVITIIGPRFRTPINFWMNITREPFSWASVFFLPLLIAFFIMVELSQNFRTHIRSFFEEFGSFASIDFDSFLFWVAVLLAFVVHEVLHGIVATANGIKIKTVGALFIPNFLYAAYVQIDYEGFTQRVEENTPPPESQEIGLEQPTRFSDPFEVEDESKRRILREVIAAGLTGNFVLLLLGLSLQVAFGTFLFAQYLVGSNLLLMGLNLFPMLFFDGGKLLPLTLKGKISDNALKYVRRGINYLTLILIFLVF